MATPVMNMVSKFSTTTSSHSSTASTLFDKLAYLEKFRDEPRQRWISVTTLVMLFAQILVSAGGLILSGLVFGDRFDVVGQCASQSFVLFASILAIPYVALHLRAAKTNFSIIRSQPFQHPLHSWTIIVARLSFLAWTVAVIATSVALARASGDKVHLELDLFFCVTAFLAMTFCLAVVEKAAEPFVLPLFSPNKSVVCRISSFGSMVDKDDSISRRGSTGSGKRDEMSEKQRLSEVPAPAGPRPLSDPHSVRLPEDDLFLPRISLSDEYDRSEQALELKMPEPTLPLITPRRDIAPPSADWKADWSIFAGEAGLRASGTSTVADMSAIAESSVSGGSSQPSAPAPYSLWAPPIKPVSISQPAPAAGRKHHKARSLTSLTVPPKRSLLETVHEVRTPTVDIFSFMGGGYSVEGALRDQSRSDSGAGMSRPKPAGPRRVARKVTVEDVEDEAFLTAQPGPETPPRTPPKAPKKTKTKAEAEPEMPKTPRMPGSFVEDYPSW